MSSRKTLTPILAAAMAFAVAAPMTAASAGDKRQEAIELVRDASETAAYFAADEAFKPMWDLADDAKAMVIIPEKVRAGFIIGGSAGDAVMIARNKDGTWSQPTFMTIGSLSFGFQAGGEASEVVLLVMTEEGMNSLLSSNVKLGGDISIAAGPIGAGAKAQTTDVLAFSRSRGLYGGVSLEGAYLKSRTNWNHAYYNASVAPAEVIYKAEVYNPASAQLQNAAWRLANKDAGAVLAPVAAAAGPAELTTSGEASATLAPTLTAPATATEDKAETDSFVYEDDAIWGEPIDRTKD